MIVTRYAIATMYFEYYMHTLNHNIDNTYVVTELYDRSIDVGVWVHACIITQYVSSNRTRESSVFYDQYRSRSQHITRNTICVAIKA